MSLSIRPGIKTGAGVDLAFALVVLASYFATFSVRRTATTLEIVLLISLGIAYLAVGIYGYGFCARSRSLAMNLVYFLVQIPLGGAIVYLGKGAGFNALVLLPLAGHSVLLLPRGWMITANLGIFGSYLVSMTLAAQNVEGLFAGLPTFVAGQVFIVVFTQMAYNEEKARTEVERLLAELGVANQRLREYALQAEELAITKERNRLAREIHDGMGHYLTTIHVQIQAAQAVLVSNPLRSQELLSSAQNLTQETLADIRRSVAALRAPPEEDLPLPERIEKLLKNSELIGITSDFNILGTPYPLSPQAELTLYRVAQESVNNTTKHAGASNIWITLDYSDPRSVKITLQDNGHGADHLDGGFGLLSLRERVSLLNGEFRISSAKGRGVTVEAVVPG
ncbi:MAG: sensor histidine kinase [Anaerolineaceae bacterium]|nr:sensor histidine kinase [Anaerolineaceae bacterium]